MEHTSTALLAGVIACLCATSASEQRQQREERLLAPTEAHTRLVAQLLAEDALRGDCICLRGDVGAGKSFFSREFIRAAYGDPYLPVPSPTYLLQNIYDEIEGAPIHHFDLYRLSRELDLQRVGWDDSARKAVCLVEWPERLGDACPAERLDITISTVEQAKGLPLQLKKAEAAGGPISCEEWEDQQPRLISLAPHGGTWEARVADLLEKVGADEELVFCRV